MEDTKKCDEVVKINKGTVVYEKPAVNYNEIATLPKGNVIKKILKEVNDRNGHIWDKVVLSDGTAGYVFSDNLEITEEYTNIKFDYDNKKYNVYFNPVLYGINMKEYPYYVVAFEKYASVVTICYSKTKIYSNLSGYDNGVHYYNVGSESVFKIDINNNGTINPYITNMANYNVIIDEDKYIASNHNIYCGNKLLCVAYIYDTSSEMVFTQEIDWNTIRPEIDAYSGIMTGEKEYNSMPMIDHILKDQLLTDIKTIIEVNLVAIQIKYPNASEALKYFLTSGKQGKTQNVYPYEENVYTNGHTRREISLTEAIHNNVKMKEKFKQDIKSIINVAEKFDIEDEGDIIIYNVAETSGDTDQKKFETDEDHDWHLTLGRYRIKMQCKIQRKGEKYHLWLRYGVEDYYDWFKDPKDKKYEEMLNEIKTTAVDKLFEEFRLMHQAGLARNYTNFGETFYNLEWTKGEKVEIEL